MSSKVQTRGPKFVMKPLGEPVMTGNRGNRKLVAPRYDVEVKTPRNDKGGFRPFNSDIDRPYRNLAEDNARIVVSRLNEIARGY